MCKTRKEHAGDLERDFSAEARILLTAVRRLPGKSWTHLEKELGDKHSPVAALRAALKVKRKLEVLKEFMTPLVSKGLLAKRTVKGSYAAFEVIDLPPAGAQALMQLERGGGPPLLLPVPELVRRADQKAAEEAVALRAQIEAALQGHGVDVSLVPEAELQPYANGGPVTEAILAYTNTIAGWRARGLNARADAHEELLERIRAWRQAEAESHRLAPASVLPDHVAMSLVKVKPTQLEALHALGVRVAAPLLCLECSMLGAPSALLTLARPVARPAASPRPTRARARPVPNTARARQPAPRPAPKTARCRSLSVRSSRRLRGRWPSRRRLRARSPPLGRSRGAASARASTSR